MLVIQIHDEQPAQRLQQIAAQENRPVEEVLKAMVEQYPLEESSAEQTLVEQAPVERHSTEPERELTRAELRHSDPSIGRIFDKAYGKARAYWESIGDSAKAALTNDDMDEQFAFFDQEGIPRLKSEVTTLEPPVGTLAYAAKIIAERGGIKSGESIDASLTDEILNEEFADYLLRRMRGKMPPNKVLVDSSYLYAFFDENNIQHSDAVSIANIYQTGFVVAEVVLTEVTFLFNRRSGIPGVSASTDMIDMRPQMESVSFSDLVRVREIMMQYQDARLDFVDCCIMALSERLNITQACTFDRRDFSIFRPKHVDYLELLP